MLRRQAPDMLSGRRILIVEDSPVVAPFAADMLNELGCVVIGPAPNMASARELIEAETLDAALLDVNIRGEKVFGLCGILQAKRVPFVITSGYADWQVPEELRDSPTLAKPYTFDQLRDALAPLFESERD